MRVLFLLIMIFSSISWGQSVLDRFAGFDEEFGLGARALAENHGYFITELARLDGYEGTFLENMDRSRPNVDTALVGRQAFSDAVDTYIANLRSSGMSARDVKNRVHEVLNSIESHITYRQNTPLARYGELLANSVETYMHETIRDFKSFVESAADNYRLNLKRAPNHAESELARNIRTLLCCHRYPAAVFRGGGMVNRILGKKGIALKWAGGLVSASAAALIIDPSDDIPYQGPSIEELGYGHRQDPEM